MCNPAAYVTITTLPITSHTYVFFMVSIQVKIPPHTLDYVPRNPHKIPMNLHTYHEKIMYTLQFSASYWHRHRNHAENHEEFTVMSMVFRRSRHPDTVINCRLPRPILRATLSAFVPTTGCRRVQQLGSPPRARGNRGCGRHAAGAMPLEVFRLI